jgi:hypothetical protein
MPAKKIMLSALRKALFTILTAIFCQSTDFENSFGVGLLFLSVLTFLCVFNQPTLTVLFTCIGFAVVIHSQIRKTREASKK